MRNKKKDNNMAPFKSDAQRKFMNAAANRGDIKQSVVDEFNNASKGKKLPKRVAKYYDGAEIKPDKDSDYFKKLKKMMTGK